VQMDEGRKGTGMLGPKSPVKAGKRAAPCSASATARSEPLQKVVQTLDFCSERGGGEVRTVWHSKQERSSWLQELHDAQTLTSIAYLLRCLQFAMRPHL
jgi:hypothetical protein